MQVRIAVPFHLKTVLQLHLLHLLACSASPVCKPNEAVLVHLHLSSHFNNSGHRVLTAQLASAGSENKHVEMDIKQRESDGDNGHVLILDTVAVVGETNSVGAVTPPEPEYEEVLYADYRPLIPSVPSGLYKVHRRAEVWARARAACEAEQALLLVAERRSEALEAARAFRSGLAPRDARRADLFFVGISDAAAEGVYVTVTGQNMTNLEYHNWHAKEPSRGPEQNGVALDISGNYHDIPNDWKLGFMCEAQIKKQEE